MADYPIIFKLTHEFRFSDHLIRVVSCGSILMTIEDGEWWCHGVQPGGLTEHGAQPASAFAAFKEAYGEILKEIAADSRDLDGFMADVNRFVMDRDEAEAARWDLARAEIRAGKQVEEPFSALERISDEFTAHVSMEQVHLFRTGEEMVALAEAA